MDNRFKFLYFTMTELWGHVLKADAGKGKTGARHEPGERKSPPKRAGAEAERNKSSEGGRRGVKKSRYGSW